MLGYQDQTTFEKFNKKNN